MSYWIEEYERALIAEAEVKKLTAEIERKQSVIEDLIESLDEAKYDEPELRSKLDKYRTALKSIAANSCCDTCREAALVAQSVLTKDLRQSMRAQPDKDNG